MPYSYKVWLKKRVVSVDNDRWTVVENVLRYFYIFFHEINTTFRMKLL